MKKILIFLMGLCMVFSVADVVHAEEETTEDDEIIIKDLTREELGEYIDINSMAIVYDVDADLLLDKIYNDLHSDSVIFSPFTNIELGISDDNGAETYNMARTAPYVVFDQDSTMYLATGNACSSGNMPYVGCCAVHPASKSNPEPIIPYGSYIQLQGSSVSIGGATYTSFTVEDTGDISFKRTLYWIDIFGGDNNDENYRMAINYGVRKVTYKWD